MSYILEEMKKNGAHGVEFVTIFTDYTKPYDIIMDVKREDVPNMKWIPKTNRRYYLIVNGEKVYLDGIKQAQFQLSDVEKCILKHTLPKTKPEHTWVERQENGNLYTSFSFTEPERMEERGEFYTGNSRYCLIQRRTTPKPHFDPCPAFEGLFEQITWENSPHRLSDLL